MTTPHSYFDMELNLLTDIEDKPKAEAKDAAHLAVRVILASIPGIGGAAKSSFNTLVTNK